MGLVYGAQQCRRESLPAHPRGRRARDVYDRHDDGRGVVDAVAAVSARSAPGVITGLSAYFKQSEITTVTLYVTWQPDPVATSYLAQGSYDSGAHGLYADSGRWPPSSSAACRLTQNFAPAPRAEHRGIERTMGRSLASLRRRSTPSRSITVTRLVTTISRRLCSVPEPTLSTLLVLSMRSPSPRWLSRSILLERIAARPLRLTPQLQA